MELTKTTKAIIAIAMAIIGVSVAVFAFSNEEWQDTPEWRESYKELESNVKVINSFGDKVKEIEIRTNQAIDNMRRICIYNKVDDITDCLGSDAINEIKKGADIINVGEDKIEIKIPYNAPGIDWDEEVSGSTEPKEEWEDIGVWNLSRYYTPVEGQSEYYYDSYETDYKINCYDNCFTTADGTDLHNAEPLTVVACDPNYMPLGTVVWIDGVGRATCHDTGGKIKERKLDLWAGIGEGAAKYIKYNKTTAGEKRVWILK